MGTRLWTEVLQQAEGGSGPGEWGSRPARFHPACLPLAHPLCPFCPSLRPTPHLVSFLGSSLCCPDAPGEPACRRGKGAVLSLPPVQLLLHWAAGVPRPLAWAPRPSACGCLLGPKPPETPPAGRGVRSSPAPLGQGGPRCPHHHEVQEAANDSRERQGKGRTGRGTGRTGGPAEPHPGSPRGKVGVTSQVRLRSARERGLLQAGALWMLESRGMVCVLPEK